MSEIDNVVLEKDAFDDDNTIELVQTEPTPSADHVEIGTRLDDVEIDDVLVHIAKTNELSVTWEKLQRILDSLINKVRHDSLCNKRKRFLLFINSNAQLWRIK